MVTNATAPGRGETKQYLVDCDDCSFERTAYGRSEATRIGTAHRRETDHELVALELPPSLTSS